MGKYLPGITSSFFPARMVGPDDFFSAPDSWVEILTEVAHTDCPTPAAPDIRFDLSESSLEANGKLLEAQHFDFSSFLETQKGTTAWHGSEFRATKHIRQVLGEHPILEYLESTFQEGMPYHFTKEISEPERQAEFEAQIARGNHKSATDDEDAVQALLDREVKHGFSMPIPSALVDKLRGAMVQPCGLASQFALQSDGSRKRKKRLTHDLSHSATGPNVSVNDRVDMDRYPEMFYGWCLLRLIHFIVCLRSDHPGVPIFIAKYDYSDAYRRISHSASAAVRTILVLGGVAYISLRLAFGGSCNPACFCAFSEALTDVANELSCSKFDPSRVTSPVVSDSTLKAKDYHVEGTPFGIGIPPAVEVPTRLTSRKDCFIDDVVAVFLGSDENLAREVHTVPLAAHVLSRPHAGDDTEPIPRKPLFAPDKLLAEGTPCEVMIVLGWLLDTRKLIVQLPFDKFVAWSQDVEAVVETKKVSHEELESLVGRLNHASFLIPLSRHFLNGLRERMDSRSRTSGGNFARKQVVRLTADELADLQLWLQFLVQAKEGISMNLLTIRTPSRMAWSDSCPFGIGGYTLRGFAWRIKIPHSSPLFGDDSVNNVLEFLGMAVSVKLLLLEAKDERYPCLLPLGDNTSAIGWMFRSGRIKRGSKYYSAVKMIAREVATDVINGKAQLTPQHLRGDLNDVSDTLSFAGTVRGKTCPLTEDNPPNDILTQRFHLFLPQLIPHDFKIYHLPDEIISFVYQVLRTLEESWIPSRRNHTPKRIELGPGGNNSSEGSGCWTPSDLEYPPTNSNFSGNASSLSSEMPASTERVELLRNVRSLWWRRLSVTPSAIWLRRFGQINGGAPSTSREGLPVAIPSPPM
jgi:hypothetical protein